MRDWFRRTDEPAALYLIAGVLLIGGPVWHYLYVNGYPFSRLEAFVLPAVAGVVGAGIAVAAYMLGANLGSLVFGALLLVFLDLQFDIAAWALSTPVLALLCVTVALVLRSRRALITCVALSAFNLASLPRYGRPRITVNAAAAKAQTQARTDPPLLVHIVLDEQWGIGGLRAAGDTALATFLTSFYLQHGFEVYEAAYSRWRKTFLSMPHLVALGGEPDVEPSAATRFRLKENPYFRSLHARGYRIHVIESDYLDYCSAADAPVASCRVDPAVSIANIGGLRGSWTKRAAVTSRFFLNATSHFYTRKHRDRLAWRRSFAGRALVQLSDVKERIRTGPPGATAIFAHVLQPHRPLEVDANCRAARRMYEVGRAKLNDRQWRVQLELYNQQVRCLHSELDKLIAEVDRVAGRNGAIILIHGDHGSRMIEPNWKLTRLNGEQLNSIFSTLLVLRRPGVPAVLHRELVPLQDYFWQLMQQDFRGDVKGPWQHYVLDQDSPSAVSIDTVHLRDGFSPLWAAGGQHSGPTCQRLGTGPDTAGWLLSFPRGQGSTWRLVPCPK